MKQQDKIFMDHQLAKAIDLIDKAIDTIDGSMTDRGFTYTRAKIVDFETQLSEIKERVYKFKEMTKELFRE